MACLEHSAWPTAKGYGTARIRIGRGSYHILVHRWVWEQTHGPIPDGLYVLHTCDNPRCINIEHLFLGTQRDNMRDMVAKGRDASSKKTHCPQGHEYTAENIYLTKKGGRRCRICITNYNRYGRK